MNKVMSLLLIVGLVGCTNKPTETTKDSKDQFNVICLDGVQYWARGWSLAPKIDSYNLQPTRCN